MILPMTVNRSRLHGDVARAQHGTTAHLGATIGFEAPEQARAREWRRGYTAQKPKGNLFIGRVLLRTEDAGSAIKRNVPGASSLREGDRFVAPLMRPDGFEGMSEGGARKKLALANQKSPLIGFRREIAVEGVAIYRTNPHERATKVALIAHETSAANPNFLAEEHNAIRGITQSERLLDRQPGFLIEIALARNRDEAEAIREIVEDQNLVGAELSLTHAILIEHR